jgi:6-phosphogluconate dehydrogenase
MNVIAASLFARFVSRQDDSPAMKAIAAMRNQFGGHAFRTEAPKGGDVGGAENPTQSSAAEKAGSGQVPTSGADASTGES